MFIAGVILGFVALEYSCGLLFALAVNALPFFVGVTAGLAAHQNGSGAIGAIVIGLVAGVVTLAAGQSVFVATRSAGMRAAIALLFAAPATVAGYHATLGLAHIGAASQGWQETFAFIRRSRGRRNSLGAHEAPARAEHGAARRGWFAFSALCVGEQRRVNARFVISRRGASSACLIVDRDLEGAALRSISIEQRRPLLQPKRHDPRREHCRPWIRRCRCRLSARERFFSLHGMPVVLCEQSDIRHISCSRMLSGQARPPRPLLWLDLAEGRLRLDRLGRNGCASTFFP